jgi:hypothetical protein
VTITSFEFAGTLGGTTATPTVQFTSTNATSISVSLYQSASDEDASFSLINTQTPTPSGTNTVTYSTTIPDRWYYYAVTVTNVTGSASSSTTHKQNTLPLPPKPVIELATLEYIGVFEGYRWVFEWKPVPEADSYGYVVFNFSRDIPIAVIEDVYLLTGDSGQSDIIQSGDKILFRVKSINENGDSELAGVDVIAPNGGEGKEES